MKLFVGLGNPGKEYSASRHNVGFMLADKLHEKFGASPWREKHEAAIAETFIGGEKILLAKPLTYMNASGRAVGQIIDYYKILPGDMIVAHDDMDLPLGKVRIRGKGGSGGHNGIKSVIACLGDDGFARFRIGIGHPAHDNDTVINHVLHPFSAIEMEKVVDAINCLVPAAECFFTEGIDMTMNRYNPRKNSPQDAGDKGNTA